MKSILLTSLVAMILFNGCSNISTVTYNSKQNKNITTQFYENEQCNYFIGPFNINDEINMDKLIKDTIEKAQDEGLYGNDMINIEVKKGGFTAILFSQYCVYIKGNIIYTKQF